MVQRVGDVESAAQAEIAARRLVVAVQQVFHADANGVPEVQALLFPRVAEAHIDDIVAGRVDVACHISRSGGWKGHASVGNTGVSFPTSTDRKSTRLNCSHATISY